YLLKQRAGVSFPTTLGTIVAERLLDAAVLVAMLTGATLVAFGGSLPAGVRDILAGGLALAISGILGLFLLRRIQPLVERFLPRRLHAPYARFAEGTLASLRRLPLLVAYSAAGWLIEGLTLYLLAAAVGSPLSAASALVVGLVASL